MHKERLRIILNIYKFGETIKMMLGRSVGMKNVVDGGRGNGRCHVISVGVYYIVAALNGSTAITFQTFHIFLSLILVPSHK